MRVRCQNLASYLQIADFSGYASNFGTPQVKARRDRIRGLAYARSVAVHDFADAAAALGAEDAVGHPITLYGVHKLAKEGTARVYWLEDGVPSVGMTAGPTLAMAAAVRGEPFRIGWSSRSILNDAPDTARAFVDAARAASEGAAVCNIPGQSVHMSEVIAAIEAAVPEARTITKTLRSRSPSNWQWESSRPRSRRSRRACARRSSCSTPAHSDTLGR
jgi:nucleoside-diphosphate-sugar epimerase